MNEASGIVPAPAIIPPPMRAFLSRRNGPSPDQIIPSFDETVRSGIREIVEFKIVLGWQLSNCGFFFRKSKTIFSILQCVARFDQSPFAIFQAAS